MKHSDLKATSYYLTPLDFLFGIQGTRYEKADIKGKFSENVPIYDSITMSHWFTAALFCRPSETYQ